MKHNHKLIPSEVCCPDHAYEMWKVFHCQDKTPELLSLVFNFSESIDTDFILDDSSSSLEIKMAFATTANELAITSLSQRNFAEALSLLDSGEVFMSGVENPGCLGMLSTIISNKAYVYYSTGKLEESSRCIDMVTLLEEKHSDIVGGILTKINRAALLFSLGAYHESYILSKEVADLIEPSLTESINTCAQEDLTNNHAFIENLQVCMASYFNIVVSLENIGNHSSVAEAAETRKYALELCHKFIQGNLFEEKLTQSYIKPVPQMNFEDISEPSGHFLESSVRGKPSETTFEIFPFDVKLVRLPDSPLPQIPNRAFRNRDLYPYKFLDEELDFNPSFLLFDYFPTDSQVMSKRAYHIGQAEYIVACSLRSANIHIDIEGMALKETISLTDFNNILHFLGIKDVLPSNVCLKFVNNFERFAQFFIFPFLRVTTDYRKRPEKVELWSLPHSLAKNNITRVFLRTSCKISIVELENNALRAIVSALGDEDYFERCVRIDLHFDEQAAAIALTYHNFSDIYSSVVKSIRETQLGTSDIEPILIEIEKQVGNDSFEDLTQDKTVLLMRTEFSGINLVKTLWIVRDDRLKKQWTISAVNLSYNHLPVFYSFSYSKIYQKFGVRINKLKYYEQKAIAFYVLDCLKLENVSEEDLKLEISDTPFITVFNNRVFDPLKFVSPVFISLIATDRSLVGVKVGVFDADKTIETGVLLVLDGNSYKKVQRSPGSVNMTQLQNKVFQETFLFEVISNHSKIMEAVKFEQNEVYFDDFLGNKCYFDSLENVLHRCLK